MGVGDDRRFLVKSRFALVYPAGRLVWSPRQLRLVRPSMSAALLRHIEGATVHWVSGQSFGLAFVQVTIMEQQHLGELVKVLSSVEQGPDTLAVELCGL